MAKQRDEEVIPVTAYAAATREEIDMQIATAKKFPRDIQAFTERCRATLKMDPAMAEKCQYALPLRKNQKPEDQAKGPSIRLAEVLMSNYGNLRVATRPLEEGKREVIVECAVHDLETNTWYSEQIARRITTKTGARYSDDMIMVTKRAAAAIARRNVLLAVVPRVLWFPLYEYSMEVAREKAKSSKEPLPVRIDRAFSAFAGVGVDAAALLHQVGRASKEEVTLDDLISIGELWTALQDKEVTVREILDSSSTTDLGSAKDAVFSTEETAGEPDQQEKAAAPEDDPPPKDAIDPIGTAAEESKATTTGPDENEQLLIEVAELIAGCEDRSIDVSSIVGKPTDEMTRAELLKVRMQLKKVLGGRNG